MLTLEDISSRIGGTLEGNPKLLVSGPSEPKLAQETHLALALSVKSPFLNNSPALTL